MVVLEGGAGSSRFEQALRLKRAGYAPRILVDADVTRDFYGKSEADMVLDFLQRLASLRASRCVPQWRTRPFPKLPMWSAA